MSYILALASDTSYSREVGTGPLAHSTLLALTRPILPVEQPGSPFGPFATKPDSV
jgi:hypothetical protein